MRKKPKSPLLGLNSPLQIGVRITFSSVRFHSVPCQPAGGSGAEGILYEAHANNLHENPKLIFNIQNIGSPLAYL